jgi:rSAM/selenodomain-associated transferase 1
LSPEDAAALAGAFLTDTVELARGVGCADVLLAYEPAEADDWFASRFPGLPRIAQRGDDLGERLAAITSDAWKLRYRPCVLIGSDAPDLPPQRITAALTSLVPGSVIDVVLCPAADGGYCLIGLGGPYGSLFRHIGWSSDRVVRDTLARAAEAELHVELTAPWYDVDTPGDIAALRVRLATADAAVAPATREWLSLHPGPD